MSILTYTFFDLFEEMRLQERGFVSEAYRSILDGEWRLGTPLVGCTSGSEVGERDSRLFAALVLKLYDVSERNCDLGC